MKNLFFYWYYFFHLPSLFGGEWGGFVKEKSFVSARNDMAKVKRAYSVEYASYVCVSSRDMNFVFLSFLFIEASPSSACQQAAK